MSCDQSDNNIEYWHLESRYMPGIQETFWTTQVS